MSKSDAEISLKVNMPPPRSFEQTLHAFERISKGVQESMRDFGGSVQEVSEAVRILKDNGKLQLVMDHVMERICYYLERRGKGKLQIDCILYANEFGELARSKEAESWFTLLAQELEQ